MTDVLRASVELPTIIFTAILAIAAFLWLLTLLGVVDVDGADGIVGDALEPLGVSEVPATVLVTIFGLTGWFVSVLASVFLLDDRSGGALAMLALVVGLVAVVVAVGVMFWVGPKLARAFVTSTAPSKRDLCGRIAEVRSATVTATSGRGEATWPDGTVSTVDIRTVAGFGVASGELKRGDRALIVDWNEESDDFYVDHVPAELID
jgi:hypothetical protein